MSNKKVFIILLNWNNWKETQECLKSLEKVDYPNFETIIVDNNSSEEDKDKVKNSGLQYIFNNENFGFAGGNNVGIKYALERGADYILLLNNDAIAAPDFLTKLVEVGESNEKFGILGSRIYQYGMVRQAHHKTDEVIFDGGKVNMWLTKGEHGNFQFSIFPPTGDLPQGDNFQVGDYITGAAILVKREVIERVGLMREEYFLYYEDVDWCIRARRTGYKCVLVPESHVWHKVSATNKEGSASYIYYHTRNGLMLAKFNGNIVQKIVAYFIGIWILLKQAVKLVFLPSKRLWARAMARGVWDFYLNKYGKYKQ